MTAVERAYEKGLFVPAYYGLKFSVAKKGARFPVSQRGASCTSETDYGFVVGTLEEAAAEAVRRNAAGVRS